MVEEEEEVVVVVVEGGMLDGFGDGARGKQIPPVHSHDYPRTRNICCATLKLIRSVV